MEISPEMLDMLVERINELYVSYRKKYVLCLPGGRLITPKRNGELYSVLTSNVLKNHLMQKYAVAIFAGPKTSRFVCFDVDDGRKETVAGIVDALVGIGFPREKIYVSFSGGKGYHVEMFFDHLVSTSRLKELHTRTLEMTGFNARQVEFRPTHGSAIKLPLSVHARTGKMCWFADRDTLELVERYDYLFEIQKIPVELFYRIVPAQRINKPPVCNAGSCEIAGTSWTIPGGISVSGQTNEDYDVQSAGTRHNLMRKIAVHMRLNGKNRAACEEALLQWYEHQDQTLINSSRDEVLADIQELLDWVFSDRFKLPYDKKTEQVRVTATDMKLVFSAANRSARRILFLLLVRSIAGMNAIAISEIAAAIELSRKSTYKAITKLRDQNLLSYESGARIRTNEGNFASDRNRYKVPHYMGRRNEPYVELQIADVMKHFDDCYHHAITQLMTESEIGLCLSLDEQVEHRNYCKADVAEGNERLDLCGRKIVLQSDVFGEIEAYVLSDRTLYPLQDVARLIGWKHPEQMSSHCKGKEKWKVQTQRQIVTKSYIDQTQLNHILQCCRSENKHALMEWLCQ